MAFVCDHAVFIGGIFDARFCVAPGSGAYEKMAAVCIIFLSAAGEKSAVRDAVMISNELGRTAAVNFIGIIHVGSDRGTGKVSNDCRKIAGIFCRGKYAQPQRGQGLDGIVIHNTEVTGLDKIFRVDGSKIVCIDSIRISVMIGSHQINAVQPVVRNNPAGIALDVVDIARQKSAVVVCGGNYTKTELVGVLFWTCEIIFLVVDNLDLEISKSKIRRSFFCGGGTGIQMLDQGHTFSLFYSSKKLVVDIKIVPETRSIIDITVIIREQINPVGGIQPHDGIAGSNMVAVRMCCNIKLQIIGGDTEGVQVGEYLIVVAGRRCDAAAQRITRIRSVRVIPVLAGVYHAENFLAIIVYTFQNDGIGAAVECQNVNFCCSISRMCVFRGEKKKSSGKGCRADGKHGSAGMPGKRHINGSFRNIYH